MSENVKQKTESRPASKRNGDSKNLKVPARETNQNQISNILGQYGYDVGKVIGQGSYAIVRSAHSKKKAKDVAIKIITKKKAPEDFLSKFLPREIRVLKKVRHHNVISLIEVIETNTRIYIITNIAENGDLLEHIRNKGALPELDVKRMFRELVDGVNYCHSYDIVHRDLKCENLLLDANFSIIISDFGFARDGITTVTGKKKLSHTFCGSYAYAPPEILKGIAYDPTLADVWSLGVIFYTMLCSRLPFDDSNLKLLLQQVHRRVEFPTKSKLSDSAKSLIYKMLNWNIADRITIKGILTHAFLDSEAGTSSKLPKFDGDKVDQEELRFPPDKVASQEEKIASTSHASRK